MTNTRRHLVTFGAMSIAVGAGIFLAIALAAFLSPQASQALDVTPTPTPMGIDVSVPVIAVPPPPTVAAIVPIGAAADTAQVDVVVSGLQPYSYVELYLHSTPVLVASGFADSTGTFKVTIKLPTTLEVGTHSLSVKGTDAGGQAYTQTVSQFAVTADRHLAGAGPGSSLISPAVSSGANAGSGSGSGSGIPTSTQTTQTDAAAAAAALGPDPFNLGGILYIGGLSTSTIPAPSPLGGSAVVSLTVKNVSHTTFDSNMDFWLTSPLGDTVSHLDQVSVAGLAPEETRTIAVTLTHVGQWPVMTAHATLRPPAAVEKTDLAPVTRDALVFIWPLFALMMLGLFVAGYALWMFLPRLDRRERAEYTVEHAADAALSAEAAALAQEAAIAEEYAIIFETQAGEADVPVAEVPVPEVAAAEVPVTETPLKPRAPRAPRKPKAAPIAETSSPQNEEGDA